MAKNKHSTLCQLLAKELHDRYGYPYSRIYLNQKYEKGECDVKLVLPKREVYYEIKSNYHPQGLLKAMEQTTRWERYQKKHSNPNKRYYGVLYTPQKIILLSCDGKMRYKLR